MVAAFCVGRLAQKLLFEFLMSISTAQARIKWVSRFSRFRDKALVQVPCSFSDMKCILRGRRKEFDTLEPRKGHFTWQVQGIGDFANFVAGAVFCGRCKNVGRRVSFAGLRFVAGANPHHGCDILR